MLVTLPSSPWPVDHFQVVNCLNEVKTKKGRERWFKFLFTYMYLFIKHILQKNLCIETVYRFIQSEMTSVHTMSVDTSLLIFNNGWTCTLLNTWSHKRYRWLVHLVASLSPPGCITRDMKCRKWNLLYGQCYGTLLVRLLCLYSTIQRPDGQTTFGSTGIVCEIEINPF